MQKKNYNICKKYYNEIFTCDNDGDGMSINDSQHQHVSVTPFLI